GGLGVALDAIGALRHMRDRDGDQLLGLGRQRAVLEHGLAELAEGGLRVGGELAPEIGQRLRRFRVQGLAHAEFSSNLGNSTLCSRWIWSIRSSASLPAPV